MMRLRKLAISCLTLGAVIAGCVFLARVIKTGLLYVHYASSVRDHVDRPQYAHRLIQLKQAGYSLNLKDLVGDMPPKEQNAAYIYLALLDAHKYPETNDEVAACKIISPDHVATPADWSNAAKFIATHRDLVSQADRAAQLDTCVVPRTDDGSDPGAIKMPELAQIRRCARIVAIQSFLLAHSGQAVAGVDNEAKAIHFGDHARRDIGLISWLVGLACDAITMADMQRILIESHGDSHVAVKIGAYLQTWQNPSLSVAVRRDFAFSNMEMAWIKRQGPGAIMSITGADDDSDGNSKLASDDIPPMSGSVWNAYMDASGCYEADLVQQEVSAADLPYNESVATLNAITARMMSHPEPKRILAAILLPDLASDRAKLAYIQSKAAITRAACAVFLYKSKHHAYPSTLADAAPTATDPFDGKPLRYRREANGFVIYSVGPTGHYDGGAFDNKKQHEEVFRYPQQ